MFYWNKIRKRLIKSISDCIMQIMEVFVDDRLREIEAGRGDDLHRQDDQMESEWEAKQREFNRAVHLPIMLLREGHLNEGECFNAVMSGTARAMRTGEASDETQGEVIQSSTALTRFQNAPYGIMDITRTPFGITLGVPTRRSYIVADLFLSGEGKLEITEVEGFYFKSDGERGVMAADQIDITPEDFIVGFRNAKPIRGKLDLV